MKTRTCAALLIALLALSLLAGCSANAVERKLDAAENAVENKLDAVENAVENRLDAVEDAAETVIRATVLPEPAAPPASETTAAPAVTEAGKQITMEEAKAIALAHAGFTADQVKFLRAEYDVDDRIPQYDIEFDKDRWEYEYEINAETGDILSYERDD